MKHLLLVSAVAASLAMPSLSFAHGGTYRGPGDITPPSGGGGGGGGGVPTPGPTGPGVPGGGGGGRTPGPVTPGGPAGPTGAPGKPGTPLDGASDLAGWEFWWAFNKDPYLALKSHLAGVVQTDSEEYYLSHATNLNARDTQRVSEEKIRSVIVPRLLAALAEEHSNDIQSSCMIALAKIGEEKSEDGKTPIADAIRGFLTSGSQELSETAAVALGILANRENLALLTAVLENDPVQLRALGLQQGGSVSVRTRSFAAYGLGLIGFKASNDDRKAINATLRMLLDGEGKTMAQRDIQVACLSAIGLAPLASDPDDMGTLVAKNVGAPKELKSLQDQLRYLLAYYLDESNNDLIRAHAPTAMARLLSCGEVPALFPMRDSIALLLMQSLTKESKHSTQMQESCALALGLIGDSDEDPTDKAIRASLMRVKEELIGQQVRNFALMALAQASGRAGHGFGDPIYGVNTENKRENARSFLLGELSKGKGMIPSWSALSLAVMERELDDAKLGSSTEVKLILSNALADAKSPSNVGALSIACGLVRNREAKDTLIANLERFSDADTRGYTAVGLGLMDEATALVPIQEMVKKSKYSPDLLKSGAIALGLLGDNQIVPDLLGMLGTATGLSSQAAISSALGFIGDSRSVDPLIALMQSEGVTDLARAFGAVALGIIADKEELPWNSKIGVGSNYRANTATLTDQKGGILDIL